MCSRFLTPSLSLVCVLLVSACARDTVSSDQIAMKESPETQRRTAGEPTSPGGDSYRGNNIRRSYSFIYSEGERRASFIATFYLADTWTTTVKLVRPSRLLVNGASVSDKELMSKEGAVTAGGLLPLFSPFFFLASGTNYFLDLPGIGSGSTISVEWTDQGGQVFLDRMTMSSFTFNAPSYASISRHLEVSIADSDQADYSATLSPKDSLSYVEGSKYRRSVVNRAKGKSIIFSQKDLSEVGPGPAELTVEKRVSSTMDMRGGNKGSGSIVYRARPTSVDISN